MGGDSHYDKDVIRGKILNNILLQSEKKGKLTPLSPIKGLNTLEYFTLKSKRRENVDATNTVRYFQK